MSGTGTTPWGVRARRHGVRPALLLATLLALLPVPPRARAQRQTGRVAAADSAVADTAADRLTSDAAVSPALRPAMTAVVWSVPPGTAFARQEGFPTGLMTVQNGLAVLRRGAFAAGTIEFDMKPLDFSDTGLQFRRQGDSTAEFVYLRADPDCPAANDCVQYAPITHGLMQWDLYPQYQGPAPVSAKGWNHVRLVVGAGRMAVYVNREASPSLVVDRLAGVSETGGIALKGPAAFANLVLTPEDLDGLPPAAPREMRDALAITAWRVSPPVPLAAWRAPTPADVPLGWGWTPLAAEPSGLVNLSRALGATAAPAVAWLRAELVSSAAQEKLADLGFARQAWLFVNGALVYAGDNPYYPPGRRLSPEGRLAPDNATVRLPLRAGRNVIDLAVGNRWQTYDGHTRASRYGWGAMLHLRDRAGVVLTGPAAAADGR